MRYLGYDILAWMTRCENFLLTHQGCECEQRNGEAKASLHSHNIIRFIKTFGIRSVRDEDLPAHQSRRHNAHCTLTRATDHDA